MDKSEHKDKLVENTIYVILKDGTPYTSTLRGVAPILNPMKENALFFEDAIVYDRVIGKAAAMLLIKSRIKELHTKLISEKAKEVLDLYHIPYTYDEECEYVVNRSNTGRCPMENSVWDIENCEDAFTTLVAMQERLRSNK